MKQRLFIIFGVFFTSFILVALVQAFTMGNIDGQWSCIEPNDGVCGSATNDNWATGPVGGSTDFDNPEFIQGWWGLQSWYDTDISIYDWNQVRYGVPTATDGGFADQSGFGFDGVNFVNDILVPYYDVPFLLGKFCHFNNPIDPPDDPLEWVDLMIRVDNISCDPNADSLLPEPDGLLNFTYRFTMDETPNNTVGYDCTGGFALCPHNIGADTYCPYQTGVNSLGCADRVDIGTFPLEDSFACYYDGAPTQYMISALGFVSLTSSLETCPTSPTGDYSHSIISGEEADNCACLYGMITEVTGTLVELNSFTGAALEEGVLLEWETASEVENLGFNIYRSSSNSEIKEKLNKNIIFSSLIGSTSGTKYAYLDTGSLDPGNYHYWLETINLSFNPTKLYGPEEVFIVK